MEEIQTIAALDLGSSLIKVVIGRFIDDHDLEIVGMGVYPSSGVKNGGIVNIETTSKGIIEAISDAELMAGCEVNAVLVNITGKHIRSQNERGIIAITNKNREISELDIIRVIEAAQSIHVPSDMEVLHVLAREFRVDDQSNIRDPVGMTGVRLESEVHIVTANTTNLNNIERCLSTSNLMQVDRVLSCLASSEAVLTQGEKDLGVAVVDIGAGICDIVVYHDGGIAYTSVVPVGGSHITNDISIGLKVTIESAEVIKKRFGHTQVSMVDPTAKIDLPAMSGRNARSVHNHELIEIIEPRAREILEFIDTELIRSGVKDQLAGGVILTGGGSLLAGIDVLAEEIFSLPVGRAKPAGLTGLADKVSSPEYSTSVGLIKYAAKVLSLEERSGRSGSDREGWASKVRRWMQDNL
ncbi:cell division protein FtsA [Leptospira sp. GIMC2001]|uniref:cell division protein FtsA n=1 Tax=Leptospira sp. GIMC2001 TaxID=1513297 RepID=UPI00234B05AA|nr:cell division protein FtsA [Leptospira sp. GIMC2001]WCL48889.1 cell division protein FtsA [Leptospira sp. GIMC2001]